jgi:uncharacterized membrane protein
MKQLTVADHPLHPQLVGVPIGLLPFSFAMDLMYHITGRKSFADASYYALVGGTAGAVVAGAAGAVDYTTIPKGSHSKQIANSHAIMNLTAVGMCLANIAMRQTDHRPSVAGTIINGITTAGLCVSQWYGGHLVYQEGMRVKAVPTNEPMPELRPPGDKAVAKAFDRLANAMPSGGPEF